MLNKVLLMGRLTRDPDVRYTANNTMVVSFSLAVGRNLKREGQPDADFINIVVWNKTAEFVAKYFVKGQQVCVCGRLATRNYDDKDGKKVYVTEVVAEEVHFADSKKDNSNVSNSAVSDMPADGFMPVVDDTQLPF